MGGLVSSYDSNADAPPDSLSLLEAIERKSDRSLQALAEKCVAYRERYPDDTARHVALRLTDRVQSPLRPVHGEYTLELDHRGLSLLTRGSSSFSNSNEPLRSADILLRHGLLVIAPFDQRNISFYAMCVTTILYQLSPEGNMLTSEAFIAPYVLSHPPRCSISGIIASNSARRWRHCWTRISGF